MEGVYSALLEKLAVEYRLFIQKSGKAPAMMILNAHDAHRYGQAVLEAFKREVAPNIEIKISRFAPQGMIYFTAALPEPTLKDFSIKPYFYG